MRINTGPNTGRGHLITIAQAAKHWEAAQPDWAPSTRARNLSILERLVLPRWGTTKLGDIRREDVQTWVNELPGPVGNRKRAHQVLSSILTWAVEAGRLHHNPTRRMRWAKSPTTRPGQALTITEVDALIAAHPPHWQPWVTWLVFTGMRVSEAAGLKAGAINRRRRTVRVEHTLVVVNGRKVTRDRAKTAASTDREIPIVDPAWLAIAPLLDGLGPGDYVFRGPRGATVNRGNYAGREFKAAAATIGKPNLHPHDLRHTAVSNAIRFGLTVKQVQAIAGHASATTTLDVYAHLFGEDWDQARKLLNAGIAKERKRAAVRSGETEPATHPDSRGP
ncbi:tyrosine-type recombinase/integrase [Cellulosimicrobium sp. AB352]|uniref:tyrosine-type recombinase/integrase n=1 Tax=Cellulosimicrobium sp. AB352 TaxID=3413281 RepID=UPI003C217F4F